MQEVEKEEQARRIVYMETGILAFLTAGRYQVTFPVGCEYPADTIKKGHDLDLFPCLTGRIRAS